MQIKNIEVEFEKNTNGFAHGTYCNHVRVYYWSKQSTFYLYKQIVHVCQELDHYSSFENLHLSILNYELTLETTDFLYTLWNKLYAIWVRKNSFIWNVQPAKT